MRIILSVFFLIWATLVAVGQSLNPDVVASTATKFTQPSGSLSFTVGELVVKSQTDGNGNTLGSGFTASTTTVTSILAPDVAEMIVKVYPNPTTDMVTLDVHHVQLKLFTLQLYDVSGKLLYTGNHAGISGKINVSLITYPVGSYLLNILGQNERVVGSYQVVKK